MSDECLKPWWERAGCFGSDPSIFVPTPGGRTTYAQARALCDSCPVRSECLNEALTLGPETDTYTRDNDGWDPGFAYGMFQAGLTPKELMEMKQRG